MVQCAVDRKQLQMDIFRVPTTEQFIWFVQVLIKHANAIVLVYSITYRPSLEYVEEIYADVVRVRVCPNHR